MGNDNTKGELTPKKQLPEALKKNIWKKGESGNPKGRPKGSVSIVEALKNKLEEVPDGQKKTYLELLVLRYMKNAVQDGDSRLIRDLIMQKQEITGKDGESLNIRIIEEDKKKFTE